MCVVRRCAGARTKAHRAMVRLRLLGAGPRLAGATLIVASLWVEFFRATSTPGGGMAPVPAFQNLTLGQDRHREVHHLQAESAEGSLTAIVGPNGAGKSRLLKRGDRRARAAGRPGLVRLLRREDLAYLPQQSDIDRPLPFSLVDLVAMGLWREIGPVGRLKGRHRARVAKAISAAALEGFEARPIGLLSGGRMQRTPFARLLLQDARLVLLDEPFTAIDVRTMADLLASSLVKPCLSGCHPHPLYVWCGDKWLGRRTKRGWMFCSGKTFRLGLTYLA